MKKSLSLLLSLLLILLLCGCRAASDNRETVAGNTYKYTKPGLGGDFTITLNSDGTFVYTEGSLSSYFGAGSYSVDGSTLILVDGDTQITNRFNIEEDRITWTEEGSDNFTYIKASDGDTFTLTEQ